MKSLEVVVRNDLVGLGFDLEMPVALAFSGGLDSTVLLDILLRIVGNGKLRAIHVCHNLRPKEELEKEISLIKKTCRARRVGLTLVFIRDGAIAEYAKRAECGIEAAARRFRYHALARTARRWNIATVVTAHHADDQLETFLMRLVHGGRAGSLAGISPSRIMDKNSEIRVLRPLLRIERRELYDYAQRKGLEWSEDSTNEVTLFLRNKIRHLLIPYLDGNFPSWRHSVGGYVPQIQDTQAFLLSFATERMRCMQRNCQGRAALDLDLFKREPTVVRLEILKDFLQHFPTAHHVGYRALQDLDRTIAGGARKAEAGGYEFDISGGLIQFKGRSRFSSSPGRRSASFLLDSYKEDQYFLKVQAPGEYDCGAFRLMVSRDSTRNRDLDKTKPDQSEGLSSVAIHISFPFVFRNKKEGDTMQTSSGVKGIDAIIKRAEVPEDTRQMVPLLEDREGIAAVFISAFAKDPPFHVVCRNPSLGENAEIVYILLSVKGDRIVNV